MRLATIMLFFLPALVVGQKAVFISGNDGYQSFRFPALVRLPDGRVLAFCEGRRKGGADSGDKDIVMRSSSDDGQTWSALRVVVDYDTVQAGDAGPVNIMAMAKRAGWRSDVNTLGHISADVDDRRLPGPVRQGMLSIGGGRMLISCNDASITRRDSLSLHISVDSGKSWGSAILVDGGGSSDHTGNCDLVDLGGGDIGVLYERDHYHEIIFTVLDGVAVSAFRLTRGQWDAVKGIYQLVGNPNMFIRFTDRDGELLARFLWDVSAEPHFLPDSEMVFIRKGEGVGRRPHIRFQKDAQGRVVEVTMGNGTQWSRVDDVALGSDRLKEMEGKYQSIDDRDNRLELRAGDSTLIVRQVWDGKEIVLRPLSGTFFFSAQPYFTLQVDFPDKGNTPESVKVMTRYTFLFTGR